MLSLIFFGYYKLSDETYTYLQYAKNIATTGEISFNPGERTYDFTSPLWLGMMAAGSSMMKDITNTPQALSLIWSIASIFVWYYILKRYFKKVPFLLLLLPALDPNLLRQANLGLETSLAFFFGSMLILQMLLRDESPEWKNTRIAVTGGLFFLVRPESVLLFAIILWYLYFRKKASKKDMAIMKGIFLAIIIPWHVFAYQYFGRVLPTTLLTSIANMSWEARLWESVLLFVMSYGALLLIGVFVLVNNKTSESAATGTDNPSTRAMLPVSLFLSIPVIYIVFYVLVPYKVNVPAQNYCTVIPFLTAAIIVLLYKLRTTQKWFNLATALVLVQFLVISAYTGYAEKKSYVIAGRVDEEIVSWVKSNTPQESKIVSRNTGKLAFMTDRRFIEAPESSETNPAPGINENQIAEHFYKQRPEYYIGDSLIVGNILGDLGSATEKIIFTYNDYLPRLGNRESASPGKITVFELYWKDHNH